jgi:hypothetical protein
LIIDDAGNELGLVYDHDYNKKITIIELIKGDYIKTCTLLFKNGIINDYPFFIDDTILAMLLLEREDEAIYISEVMAKYRVHDGGVWSKKNRKQRIIEGFQNNDFIIKRYKNRFPKEINERLNKGNLNSALTLISENEIIESYKYFKEFIINEKSKLIILKAIMSVSKILLKTILIQLYYKHEKK